MIGRIPRFLGESIHSDCTIVNVRTRIPFPVIISTAGCFQVDPSPPALSPLVALDRTPLTPSYINTSTAYTYNPINIIILIS